MKTILTPFRTLLVIAVAATGFMAVAAAQQPTPLPNQCWRFVWQPEGACPICAFSCRGAPFKCCGIVTD